MPSAADNARTLAKGLEDGMAPDQVLSFVPATNLRIIAADLRRIAGEHDALVEACRALCNWYRATAPHDGPCLAEVYANARAALALVGDGKTGEERIP